MDLFDAETAVGMIADLWPRSLDPSQIATWAKVVSQTGADFDVACKYLVDLAGQQTQPPRLAELCTAIRPRRAPATPVEDEEPPAPLGIGQQWAAHVASVARNAGLRKELHLHQNGWQQCPVCTTTSDYRICHNPICFCAP